MITRRDDRDRFVFAPGKLWSLWDVMERLRLDAYWDMAAEWSDSVTSVYMAEMLGPDDPGRVLNDDEKGSLVERLNRLLALSKRIGLKTAPVLIEFKIAELPTTLGEMNMIWLAVKSEMKSGLFLSVPSEKANFYNLDKPISQSGMDAFPNSAQELRYAGNAFVADLPTASVYHCMRALEYGLLALASDLQVTVGTQTWHGVLNDIEAAITKERAKQNAPNKNVRLQFLSEAANEFRHFKDGWRNYASHVKVNYDDSQAARIMQHVGTFIDLLSKELREVP